MTLSPVLVSKFYRRTVDTKSFTGAIDSPEEMREKFDDVISEHN